MSSGERLGLEISTWSFCSFLYPPAQRVLRLCSCSLSLSLISALGWFQSIFGCNSVALLQNLFSHPNFTLEFKVYIVVFWMSFQAPHILSKTVSVLPPQIVSFLFSLSFLPRLTQTLTTHLQMINLSKALLWSHLPLFKTGN